MNNRIKAYVDSLFASYQNIENITEIKEELILNLNDKYDDLCTSGIPSDEAFIKVISSIGDVDEIIGVTKTAPEESDDSQPFTKSNYFVPLAVMLFILSPVPVIIMEEISSDVEFIGIVLMFFMIGIGVFLLILRGSSDSSGSKKKNRDREYTDNTAKTSASPSGNSRILNPAQNAIVGTLQGLIWIAAVIFFMIGIFNIGWTVFLLASLACVLVDMVVKAIALSEKINAERKLSPYVIQRELKWSVNAVIWLSATIGFFILSEWGVNHAWLIFLMGIALTQIFKLIMITKRGI